MRLRHFLYMLVTLALCASAAFAFLDFKLGYTKTMGELSDRYDGGMFINLGIKLPLPGPLYIVPNGTYTSLGKDALFGEIDRIGDGDARGDGIDPVDVAQVVCLDDRGQVRVHA